MFWQRLLLFICFPVLIQAQENPVPIPALTGFDPVELCRGREVPGVAEFSLTAGHYLYQFVSESNRTLFNSAPDRYGIQFDGYCMRMGPLTGYGAPDRWYVQDGKIYLFASDACRDRFKSNPARFIDCPDPLPTGASTDSARVRQLMNRAIEAIGGVKKLDSVNSFRMKLNIAQTHNDQVYRHTREVVVSFPASCRFAEDYGTAIYGWKLIGNHGWVLQDTSKEVDPLVRDFMIRHVYRHPLVIFKAWQAGEGVAVYQGEDSIDNHAVEKVAFAQSGATTVLHVSKENGTILATSFTGRSGPGIGQVMREFSDFREVDGLTVPFGLTTRFEREIASDVKVQCEYWKFNQPGDHEALK